MIRRIASIVLLAAAYYQPGAAQVDGATRWHAAAGVVFPSAPEQFYDYWKQGYQVMGGTEFPSSTRFIQMITVEANYFPFDQDRFLKRLGINNDGTTTISGSTTLIFSLSYLFKYPFTEYKNFQPSFFAGLGCSDIFRTSASVGYPNYEVSQGSRNSVVATIPFGGSIIVFQRGGNEIEINFTYTIGLSKNQETNSNYTSLKLDYSFSP